MTTPPVPTDFQTSALLIALAVCAVGALAAHRRHARWWHAAAMAAASGCVIGVARLEPGWTALTAALAALGAAGWWWVRRGRTSATVTRWGAASRRKIGVASTIDLARTASGPAMRRRAATVRPSTAAMTRRQRARLPIGEVAVELCRTSGIRLYASVEDVTVIFGGPRTGKTGWLAGRIIDAPGALLVTSTRTDVHDLTAALRARRGPVGIFNAAGLGGLASTITFDPLTGCRDATTAAERAADMLGATSTGGGGDREFWDGQARRVLGALLHAAALGELGMREVLDWVSDPDTAQARVTALLRRAGDSPVVQDAAQFLATNDRTRSSITSTIMPALGWLARPAAAAAAEPGRSLDVAQLLRDRGTVYLLGAEESQTAPLVCALTGHIAREARRIAASRPGGRLDPPLTLALDEAALICPVPLHQWTADMGGRGVTILAAFQSRAQLLDRYGEARAAVILNNTTARLLFGGTADRDDLTYWSTLAGERDEPVVTTDDHGRVTSRSVRKVPVLSAAQLANLPGGHVVVFRRGMAPAVGRVQMAWRRRDVRAQARVDARTTRAVVDAAETATRETATHRADATRADQPHPGGRPTTPATHPGGRAIPAPTRPAGDHTRAGR
ncbi:type IV secretory system conjugative DNA transfer family protein [Pseudonocardia sp. ICBG601]|uniref:type IV secretory system conjugative DNA transfer family protein n=1 Tax=Pseudonocardia sp. ICBG601 TaxID=2846759 RepID=UPI001CF6E4E6|nr:TraM recognition domain-containing protein [Pseudonocardia sp. ICBG601]